MPTPGPEPLSLRGRIAAQGGEGRFLWGPDAAVSLDAALTQTRLPELAALAGATVLVRTEGQLAAALLLIELDGLAGSLILCPPDLDDAHLPHVMEAAGVDVVVGDRPAPEGVDPARLVATVPPRPRPPTPAVARETDWILFTSGTTGRPKMVAHTLAGLTGAIRPAADGEAPPVWGTFYDVRRYGGLQMLLRALTGGGSIVLSSPGEATADFLRRLGEHGVTHLSATPSHWRKALMSPALGRVSPRYVRLSGEIADQAVLDHLAAAFPQAAVGHAYASTEAGVGFEVDDGREGFPAAFVGAERQGGVLMAVVDGSLRLRSPRTARGYVGPDAPALADADGFVDTGDMVELRGDRHHFVGRRGGVINVGGLKIHPEEVEAVINRHPLVRMSRVRGRRSPVTGAVVVAEVVPRGAPDPALQASLKTSILDSCRAELAPHKTPVSISFVEALAVTAGGKLERLGA